MIARGSVLGKLWMHFKVPKKNASCRQILLRFCEFSSGLFITPPPSPWSLVSRLWDRTSKNGLYGDAIIVHFWKGEIEKSGGG